jgi:hypothetical protein
VEQERSNIIIDMQSTPIFILDPITRKDDKSDSKKQVNCDPSQLQKSLSFGEHNANTGLFSNLCFD